MLQAREFTGKERIALYGGAFDPVHAAHLKLAFAALEEQKLDRVVFIPAAKSPLKTKGPNASDAARFKMLELAAGDEPRFEVDDCEIKRGGVSYTVDTVRDFKGRYPEAELYWIIGADQLEQLDRWHAIEELAGMVVFLVLARPGHELSAPPVPGLIWIELNAPIMDESSTLVREAMAAGDSLKGLVPETVEAFIRAEGLYI